MHVEVERGDGVSDTLQVVPFRRVLSADTHQVPWLGASHQPITGLHWDLDGHETQDRTGVDVLQEEEK